MTRFIWLAILLLLAPGAWASNAADGTDAPFPRPANAPADPDICVNLCTSQTGDPAASATCGPVYAPIQGSPYTEFRFIGKTVCAFDTLDIVEWHSATAPSSEHTVILGTLDDDGTADCGLGAGNPCKASRWTGPIFGWVWVTSNGASIGGTGCTSWRLLMCQAPRK